MRRCMCCLRTATAFFESWSRGVFACVSTFSFEASVELVWCRWTGVGANLLAANEGMGMMHTGSGIFSQGKSLVAAWEPANPHDEALLIATVPKLQGRSTPVFAGGAPPKSAWGGGPLSAQTPVFTVITISKN